jgi:hypothetical protein
VGDGTESAGGEPALILAHSKVNVESGTDKSTALVVNTNLRAKISWSQVGSFDGLSMEVDTDGEMNAVSSVFRGDYPPTGAGTITFARCSEESSPGEKPITDTETASSY